MIADWDDAYANAPHIPGGSTWPARWEADAAAFRATRPPETLIYGEHPRERIDLFRPAEDPHGLVVFVHGGYWRAFDRHVWSHLAGGPLARGWAVALPGYVLAPEARVSAITRAIARAVAVAAGAVAGPLRLAGHSAGGHLVARQLCADTALSPEVLARVGGTVSISGVHDLRPLLRTGMNVDLRLDHAEAASESPAMLEPLPGTRVHAWVGDLERPEFVRQTTLIANIWTGLGADMTQTIAAGRHHFNVIEDLADAGSALVAAVLGEEGGSA